MVLLIIAMGTMSSFLFLRFKDDYPVNLISPVFNFIVFIPLALWFFKYKKHKELVILSIYAIVIESAGVLACFPYSCFEYSDMLGVKMFNLVPLTLPLNYIPIVVAGSFMAFSLVRQNLFFSVFMASLLCVTFDLVLDPAAVSIKLWEFEMEGIFYGVPLENFMGWLLTSIPSCFLIVKALRDIYTKEMEGKGGRCGVGLACKSGYKKSILDGYNQKDDKGIKSSGTANLKSTLVHSTAFDSILITTPPAFLLSFFTGINTSEGNFASVLFGFMLLSVIYSSLCMWSQFYGCQRTGRFFMT